MTDSAACAARDNMIARQLRPNQVRDSRILDAMGEIPREAFLPLGKRGIAYADDAIAVGQGRFLLSPMVFGRLVEEAGIGPTDRVLDVGCLTGYSTAVLARLAASVVAIDSEPEFVDQAHTLVSRHGAANAQIFVVDDLAGGYADGAPYDVILCEGAVDCVPEALRAQLRDDGRLLAVIDRSPSVGQATLFERSGNIVSSRALFEAGTPRLPGFAKTPGFVFA
jgi:protein-L-isoaspartate(D-aspartate) O-methyltransferase